MSSIGPVVQATRKVAQREAVRSPVVLWWSDPKAEEWERIEELTSHLQYCTVDRKAVSADPFAFDQWLLEWSVCKRCRANDQFAQGSGYKDCPLGWDKVLGVDHGTPNWYLDLKERVPKEYRRGDDGAREPWTEWVKRRCAGKELRAQEIAVRLKRYRDIGGGIRAVEV